MQTIHTAPKKGKSISQCTGCASAGDYPKFHFASCWSPNIGPWYWAHGIASGDRYMGFQCFDKERRDPLAALALDKDQLAFYRPTEGALVIFYPEYGYPLFHVDWCLHGSDSDSKVREFFATYNKLFGRTCCPLCQEPLAKEARR
jgi:hypothetical protein